MADNPFDQTNIGLRERPVSSDHNQMQSQIYRTIREIHRSLMAPRSVLAPQSRGAGGFAGDSFRVVPSSPEAMSVVVTGGMGFLFDAADAATNLGTPDLEHVDDLSPYKPISLLTPVTLAIPAAPSAPNKRIDIVEVRNGRRLENSITRRQLDSGGGDFNDHLFFKALAYGADGQTGIVTDPAPSTAVLSYKVGVPGNPTGALPGTTPGYTRLAVINVPNGTTTIAGTKITDKRKMLGIGGCVHASIRFRLQWSGGTPIVTILSVVAPPGIEFAIDPMFTNTSNVAQHGATQVWIFGGDFNLITMTGVVELGPSLTTTATGLLHLSYTLPGVFAGLGTVAVAQWPSTSSAAFSVPANAPGSTVGVTEVRAHEFGQAPAPVLSNGFGGVDDIIFDLTFRMGY